KACVEYFPKKDRAFSTSIFNSGTTIGALLAPLIIPVIAAKYGWEMSFIIIGALGFIWMGFWQFIYKKQEENPRVNAAELAYIKQEYGHGEGEDADKPVKAKVAIRECLNIKSNWALIFGKFLTDGVWWFILFWFPAYLSSVNDIKSSDIVGQLAI